jgi:purine-nucleoside phosphorylase
MADFITISQIDETCAAVRSRMVYTPKIGLILGSGLSSLADRIERPIFIPFDQLPHWPISTVQGHEGRLVVGFLEGQPVMAMQGRVHYYEGYSMDQIVLPVRVMQRLNIEILIITNAAGAVNQNFDPGQVMLITDHLNIMGMAGLSPLRGPNLDEFGPRFPDMSAAYDPELRQLSMQVAAQNNIRLQQGVYAALAGPSFESPADLRFLKTAGADAVGMSTVPEVITARHGGTRVLGFSGISNKANLDGTALTTHEEVLEAGEKIVPQLLVLVQGVLKRLAA